MTTFIAIASHIARVGALNVLALAAGAASAAEVAAPTTPADQAEALDSVRFVVGGVMSNTPIYWGQAERHTGLKPMLALRWGRLRISNSGAGGLIGEGSAGGASTDLVSNKAWRVTAGLRIDRGRRIENDGTNRLEDLTRVRGTLRARLLLRHALSDDLSATASLASDVLNRQGGSILTLGLTQQLATPEWLQGLGGQWSAGVALVAGDATYMRSYFGVAQGARRFAPYDPGAGWRNASVGLGWRRSFGAKEQWVLFGGAGVQRLLGPAADAPFIQHRSTWTADVGLAYRR